MIKTAKQYVITCFSLIVLILLVFVVITYIYDPYFHYHKPYDWVSYRLNYQRYQNDGIVKHFDYDAIITGNSMTENFKTSEFDQLFDSHSIKVPFAGATYKELGDTIKTALENNENIKIILCSLGIGNMLDNWDNMKYDLDYYPWYLYDNLLYNDVKYFFNKSIFFGYIVPVIKNTKYKLEPTTFDEYSNWNNTSKFGKEKILNNYVRKADSTSIKTLSETAKKREKENIEKNIIQYVTNYPNVEFYYFVPPHSMLNYDDKNQSGELEMTLDYIEYAISLLVDYENVHVYSFMNEYDIVTNLEIYRDSTHYNEDINSQMLKWMKEGHGLLTKDNYQDYMKKVKEYYTTFDYDSLFSSK